MGTIRVLWKLKGRVAALTLMTLGALTSIVLSAQAQTPTAPPSSTYAWTLQEPLTPANLISAGVLIFHFGMLRQVLTDLQKRLAKIEAWRDEGAPDTFARQDRTADRLEQIDARLERIEERLP
jgi:hypothetical protein